MIPACPCCARVVSEADVVPDGCYIFGSRSLVSFKCPCGTNRAIRFEDATQELRRATKSACTSFFVFKIFFAMLFSFLD